MFGRRRRGRPPNDVKNDGESGNDRAELREELAVLNVKGQLSTRSTAAQGKFLRDIHFAGQDAFGESVAGFIPQNLGDSAKLIDKTCDASIGGANHRAARFNATEQSIMHVLSRTG